MANHKSAIKRSRSDQTKRERNRYKSKTMRNAVKKLRNTKDKKGAEDSLPKVLSMVDKLVKVKVIHKNKAANLKAKLTRHVNSL